MRPSESLQHRFESSLRPRLERMAAKRRPDLPAPQVLIITPGVRLSFGEVDRPFHTASAGKPFVAVAAARLAQQGLLSLDAPIGELAPGIDLSPLPAAPGVILSRDLTLSHLLSHRSGLPDPVQPPRGHSTECSLDRLMRRPDRHWGLAEVVAQCAGLPPQGRPGERFAYGDANYALAQCVLQEVTGLSAHEVLRTQVFQPAGMTHTGQPHSTATDEELAGLKIAPVWLTGLKIAPVWVKGAEISHARALSAGSADGGAVTTLEDMVRFQKALHEGDLLDRDLLARLARPRSRLRAGLHYGTGLATIRFSEFMPLVLRDLPEPMGGLGLWAVHSFFYPRQRAHVVMNLHSTAQMQRSFALHIAIARRLARLS